MGKVYLFPLVTLYTLVDAAVQIILTVSVEMIPEAPECIISPVVIIPLDHQQPQHLAFQAIGKWGLFLVMIRVKIILIFCAMLLCTERCLAATGDIIYQNCTSTCDESWERVAEPPITIESSNCHSNECYKLVFTETPGSPAIGVSAISGYSEITLTYWTKFNKNSSSITSGNIKGFRPYVGGSTYAAAEMSSHFGYSHYITSSWDGSSYGSSLTFTPTAAVTQVHTATPPDYCEDIGGGDYSCPRQLEINFSVNGDANYPANTWRKFRMWIKLPSTTSSADGEIKMWIDDVQLYAITDWDLADGCQTTFSGITFYPSEDAGESYEHWMDDIIIYEGYVPPEASGSSGITSIGVSIY